MNVYPASFLAKRFGCSEAQIKAQYLSVGKSMLAEVAKAKAKGSDKIRTYSVSEYEALANQQIELSK